MAKVPLVLTAWEYDTETKMISAKFMEAVPEGHPNPVEFKPDLELCLELLPRVVDEEPVVQPEQEEIKELKVVVDQVVLDMLMASLMAMNPDMEGLM